MKWKFLHVKRKLGEQNEERGKKSYMLKRKLRERLKGHKERKLVWMQGNKKIRRGNLR